VPLTEGPAVDQRTEDFRWLVDYVRGDDSAYRAAAEKQRADAEEREAIRLWMTTIAKKKRPKKPGSRPWQRDGFRSRALWLDHNRQEPPLSDSDQTPTEV
jgi:hypothetical protein